MKAIVAAVCLVLGVVTPVSSVAGADKYTCVFGEGNPFPDGSTGIAEVAVKVRGNGNTVVSVDYFSEGYAEYLGQYQERNGDFVPEDKDQACEFAELHYEDRD